MNNTDLVSMLTIQTKTDTSGFDKLSKSIDKLVLATTQMNSKMDKGFRNMNKNFKNHNRVINDGTKGMHKFKMEFLGVMFLGMSMKRFAEGLLQPAAELIGMFDIWGTVLQVVFLPIMLELLPLFMWLVETFLNMSDTTKKVIGAIVLLIWGFGTVLFFVGQMTIGFNSLMLAMPQLAAAFSIGFWPLLTIIIVVVAGLYLLVKYFKVVQGTFQMLGGVIKIVIAKIMEPFGALFSLIATGLNMMGLMSDETAAKWGRLSDKSEELAKSGLQDIVDGSSLMAKGFKEGTDSIFKDMDKLFGKTDLSTKNGFNDMNQTTTNGLSEMSSSWNSFYDKDLTATTDYVNKKNDLLNQIGQKEEVKKPTPSVIGGNTYIPPDTTTTSDVINSINDAAKNMTLINNNPTTADILASINNPTNIGTSKDIPRITQNIYVTTSNKEEISRMIDNNNKKLVDDITRRVGA